ncbi:discoidin domain-containing protein [Hymenobacter ruricola]|uniref:Discoidin domain-containing protein n=1 Tax=Hymenobacter ruricola TaxID=2791023 RepID=A0ABS0HZP7_9BACT|nr:discoidin domain-containing protein [Hymenobacter ruricola]MBF9220182.1 discoidin domain-containing protein [Hymenobacter ruricola]
MNQTIRRALLGAALILGGHQAAQAQTGGVGIGTATPDGSALLDLTSGSKGLLAPRLSTAQRQAISSPAKGLLVYQTDASAGFYYFDGVNWIQLPSGLVPNALGVVPTGTAAQYDNNAVVSTVAGAGQGFQDGPSTAAQFNLPRQVALDAAGVLYVADQVNSRIRKILPDGTVSTLAGSGASGAQDGPGASASFNQPYGVAVDAGGVVYVADIAGSRVRKVLPDGTVSTLALTGSAGGPAAVAVDASGVVYAVAGNQVLKILPNGTVSTLAGSGTAGYQDGAGAGALFNTPSGIAVDAAGVLYVADGRNHRIRKVLPNGTVSTLAGSGTAGNQDGPGATAQFNTPVSVAVDAAGAVYVGSLTGGRIRKVLPDGTVSTLAGNTNGYQDGPAATARFGYVSGVAVDPSGGLLYLSDTNVNAIRKVARGLLANAVPAIGNQQLSLAGQTLSLSGGNSVTLPNGADNLGNHTATQNLNLNGNQLVGVGRLDLLAGADNNGSNDPGAVAFQYRTGGYRHWLRSRHDDQAAGAGNNLDFFLNSSTTAAGSIAPGAGNIQVLTLQNNGGQARVGIGTATPSQALDVAGNVQISGSGNGLKFPDGTTQTTAPRLTLSGQTLGLGGGNTVTLPVGADNLGNHTATKALDLNGNALVSGGTTGLSISSTGNVGIGAGSPGQKLEVAGQVFSSTGGFRFPDNTVQTTAAAPDNLGNHTATQPLKLNDNFLSNNGNAGLRIDNNGRVGVGTVSPTAALHVTNQLLGGGPNVAAQATITASSTLAGTPAANAIDGNTGTGWSAALNQPMPQWLQLDYGGQPRVISRYSIYLRRSFAASGTWDLQGSNNASAWTTLHTVAAAQPVDVTNSYSFANTTAYRYYRLLVKTASDGSARSDVEVNEWGLLDQTAPAVALRVDPGALQLGSGAVVNTFSADATLAGNADDAVPTQKAVKTYVDAHNQTLSISGSTISLTNGGSVTVPSSADNLGNHTATQNLNLNGNLLTGGGSLGLRMDASGNANFGTTTRQMLNLWDTNYGIGIQDNTQYFRSADSFAWFTGGVHNNSQLNAGGGATPMVLKAGQLGIGTSAPVAALDVPNGSVHLPGDSWIRYSGDNKNYLRGTTILADDAQGGRVGIGTANPAFPLDVQSAPVTPGNFAYGFLNGSGSVGYSGSNTGPVSIRATGRVLASEFNATSDRRLKTVIGLSNNAADLALLNQLRITDYTMRDRVQYGTRRFKKVIAQEVEAVFPQAVNQHAGFLPDVYALATSATAEGDSLLRLTLPKAAAATAGQRVKLIGPAGEVTGTVAKAAGGTQWLVRGAAQLAGQQVFVFGLEHADVRTVDYEALAMLNVSATQELARQLAELQKQNAVLKAEAAGNRAELQQFKAEASTQTANLAQRLQALENMLGTKASVK